MTDTMEWALVSCSFFSTLAIGYLKGSPVLPLRIANYEPGCSALVLSLIFYMWRAWSRDKKLSSTHEASKLLNIKWANLNIEIS